MALEHEDSHLDAMEKASRLAPPEEQARGQQGAGSDGRGAIIVDTGELKLPKNFGGGEKDDSIWYRPDPVVIFILCAVLLFIAFIALLIARMPGK